MARDDYYARNRERVRRQQKEYWRKNRKRLRATKNSSKYGLTVDEWKRLLRDGCRVCRSRTTLCVDHDHRTGRVRGCLCSKCNQALGLLGESRRRIASLLRYCRRYV